MRLSTPFNAAFADTMSGAFGSTSAAVTAPPESTAAAMPSMPLPQPRSSVRIPGAAYFSTAARHIFVVGWSPVPNSSPGSSRTGTRSPS